MSEELANQPLTGIRPPTSNNTVVNPEHSAELKRLQRALLLQTAINWALVRATNEEELFSNFCRILVDRGGYKLAWVGIAEILGGKRLVKPIAQAGFEEGYLQSLDIAWDESEAGRGPTGTAIRSGQPKVVQDNLKDPIYSLWSENARRRGYKSSIALPLKLKDQVFGALNLYSSEENGFDEEETTRLLEVASELTFGMQNFRTQAEQKRQEQQLREKEVALQQLVAERNSEVTSLLEVSQQVAATSEPAPLADLILDQLHRLVDYTEAGFFTYSEGNLFPVRSHSSFGSLRFMTQQINSLSQSDALLHIIQDQKPLLVRDLLNEAPFNKDLPPQLVEALHRLYRNGRAMICLPLKIREDTVGLILLVHSTPGFYTPYQLELVKALGNQAAISLENARLYQQAQNMAALEERQRLARELHDSTSQVLFSIQLGTHAIGTFLERKNIAKAQETLEYVQNLAKSGLDEMRALIYELRPEFLEREGLLGAILKLVASQEARHGLKAHLQLSEDEPALSLEYKEVLYRIVREAIHNIVKHANSEQLRIFLGFEDDGLCLEIEDYGVGFNPDAEFPGHLGLQSIRERVTQLKGQITIHSEMGKGTLIRVTIPLNRPK